MVSSDKEEAILRLVAESRDALQVTYAAAEVNGQRVWQPKRLEDSGLRMQDFDSNCQRAIQWPVTVNETIRPSVSPSERSTRRINWVG